MRALLSFLVVSLLVVNVRQVSAIVAATPPMGWNSWNHFHCRLNEMVVRQTAELMVKSGLKDAGYIYVNLDDCWQLNRTSDGVIVPDQSRFSDFPGMIKYINSLGLKFGLYTDRGTMTCQKRPGSYAHEMIDAKTYASWNVSYVKNDDCNIPKGGDADTDYGKMSAAINSTGHEMVHSVKGSEPIAKAYNVSNMRRVGHDIGDNFHSMVSLVLQAQQQGLAQYAHPGFWNDLDMLEIGNGGMSTREYTTHMSLWALLKAPLLLGNDLSKMDNTTLAILTNKEVLAINQDPLGKQGTLVASQSANSSSTVRYVVSVPCDSNSKTQKWSFDEQSGVITNEGTGGCLDSGSGSNGQVITAQCKASPQQSWTFIDGQIHPKSSNDRCLDVYNYKGPVVQLYNCKKPNSKGCENQEFNFSSDGSWKPDLSNMCIDLGNGSGDLQVWAGPLQGGSYSSVLFNYSDDIDKNQTITLHWKDIGVDESQSFAVRDLWQHKDLGTFKGSFEASVPGHGVTMVKLTPSSD